MPRGPSAAVIKAASHLQKHPGTTAPELAKKFGVNEATIYRAAWYKNRPAAQPQTGEK